MSYKSKNHTTKVSTKNRKMLEWLKTIDANYSKEYINASLSYLRLIAYGHKRPSAKVATSIEMASNGYITRKELRPHDWHEIWPEIE